MSEIELELCPHCKSTASTVNRKRSEQDEWHIEAYCSICDPFHMNTYSVESWNTRPIEDALRARAERAEADAERLADAGELLAEGFATYLTANGYGPSIQMVNCQNGMFHAVHEYRTHLADHEARKAGQP
jgi:hypothetical protein